LEEKVKVNFKKKIIVFQDEENFETLVIGVKKQLMGKETYEKIVVGIESGAIGVVTMTDGKIIEQDNYYSSQELIKSILKILRTFDFAVTSVLIKVGMVFQCTKSYSKTSMNPCQFKRC